MRALALCCCLALLATAEAGPQRDRRMRLLARLGKRTLVVWFRRAADRDYRYLTGLDRPSALIATDNGGSGLDVICGKGVPREGFDAWLPLERCERLARKWLESVDVLAVPRAKAGTPEARLTRLARERGVRVVDVRRVVWELRMVKDAEELRQIQRAIDITGCAMLEAMRTLAPDVREGTVGKALEGVFRRHEADRRNAFPSIVAAGPNGCVLHHRAGRRAMRAGELVVIDIGARVGGYCADVTRTLPVSGTFTAEQRALYNLVLEAQAAALARVRPGATLLDLHRAAVAVFDREGVAGAFVHDTSHYLGLDVHDVGSMAVPLRPGMVLTVEPGLYFPRKRLGIRIEDDVVVTQTGHRVLSGWLPKTVAEIEKWLALEDRKAAVAAMERAKLGR